MSTYAVFVVKKNSEFDNKIGSDEKCAAEIFSVISESYIGENRYVSALEESTEHSFLTLEADKFCGLVTISAENKEVWEKRYKNIAEKAQVVFDAFQEHFTDYYHEITAYEEAVANQSDLGEYPFSDCGGVSYAFERIHDEMGVFREIYEAIEEEFEIQFNN